MFYPPKGLCEAEPYGVHLTVFPFYCVPETYFGIFVSGPEIRLSKILKTWEEDRTIYDTWTLDLTEIAFRLKVPIAPLRLEIIAGEFFYSFGKAFSALAFFPLLRGPAAALGKQSQSDWSTYLKLKKF